MIRQVTSTLKVRHETPELCQVHLDKITKVNAGKILDSGIDQDDKGNYSWIKIKEWVNE